MNTSQQIDALDLLKKAEEALRRLHELDAEEADELADNIRSLLIAEWFQGKI